MPDDQPSLPKPQVNDAYWYQYAKNLVDNAVKSRDESAVKLQTLVIWLWGIYTAAGAVGFTLAGKALPFGPKCLIVAASVALIAVYWSTVWVQTPSLDLDKFAPNDVQEIKAVYKNSLADKTWRLKATLALSLVAAMLVATSIVVASLAKEEKSQAPSLVAAVKTVHGRRFLAFTAKVPDKTETVTVTIEPKKTDTGVAPTITKGVPPLKPKIESGVSGIKSHTAVYVPTPEGLVQKSIPLEGLTPPLEITLAWTDTAKKLEATLTQTVQEPPTAGTKEAQKSPTK